MQAQLIFAAVLLALAGSTQHVEAYGKYVKLIPNGAAVPDAPAVGHVDAEGAEGVNDFGKAFKKAGNAWTKELCMADTDGDGFTNGQELGDPCCTWTPTSTAGLVTAGISHPSDKTKTPSNAKLIAGCSTATTAGSTTAAATTNATTTTTAPAATTTKPKETVTDVLAPVSATASPNASTVTSIDDFADSMSGSDMSSMTPTPTATKKNSTANSTNTTSGAASTTGSYGASSLAATVAVVCASALLAAF